MWQLWDGTLRGAGQRDLSNIISYSGDSCGSSGCLSGDTMSDFVTVLSSCILSRRPTHSVVGVECANDGASGLPCQRLPIVFHHRPGAVEYNDEILRHGCSRLDVPRSA